MLGWGSGFGALGSPRCESAALQEERSRSEHNLINIQKTHERMQTENKISPYYRTKLRGLYTTAKADAEAECNILRKALDKIAEIKSLLEERRIGTCFHCAAMSQTPCVPDSYLSLDIPCAQPTQTLCL